MDGMTNEQYKGMLLDQLEDWENLLELAKQGDADNAVAQAVQREAEKQIAKIIEKMKF